jgi:hypothetical protein
MPEVETTVLSYGMGVESTAILLRWCLEEDTRCDLGRKVAAFDHIFAVRVARRPCVWCRTQPRARGVFRHNHAQRPKLGHITAASATMRSIVVGRNGSRR